MNGEPRYSLVTLNGRIEESTADIQVRDLPTVAGDEAQFAHVFQNLLSNALKYRSSTIKSFYEPLLRVAVGAWDRHGKRMRSSPEKHCSGCFCRVSKPADGSPSM